MSGDGPTQVEYGTLARIRSSADRQPPGSLHPGVSGRRSIGLLRDLRRSRHVVEPAPRVRVGPHRWEPDKQSPGKPAADLSELRLAATDVQKPESRPRSPPPPTAVRRQSVVLKSAPALPITPGWTPPSALPRQPIRTPRVRVPRRPPANPPRMGRPHRQVGRRHRVPPPCRTDPVPPRAMGPFSSSASGDSPSRSVPRGDNAPTV